MAGVRDIRGQVFRGGYRGKRISRKRGVRDDANETALGNRACRPKTWSRAEPALSAGVMHVGRPEQGDQKVDVEEEGFQRSSSSSLRTCSDVILGESSGKSKTVSPFTFLVGRGASAPFRRRSETALPIEMRRPLAKRRAIRSASSSIVNVVRISNNDATALK